MSRLTRFMILPTALVVALLTAACGTQHIAVKKQAAKPAGGNMYHGAVLFSERCAGCHTLSFAGTHGSAPNIRSAQGNSGPNFNTRCERPIDRVLYAIENGGFSGQYMPQNIVGGHDAVDVAEFVSRYAGQYAASNPGQAKCWQKPIGALPASTSGLNGTNGTSATASVTPAAAPAKVASRRTRAKKHA